MKKGLSNSKFAYFTQNDDAVSQMIHDDKIPWVKWIKNILLKVLLPIAALTLLCT